MQAVIFIGIQGSGKSTFFKERFFDTHVRISLDLLRTRHREMQFLQTCLKTQQPFVVDNTNPTARDRARYIEPARRHNFKVMGYYFGSQLQPSLARNLYWTGRQRIPEKGLLGTYRRLQLPAWEEGFEALYTVRIGPEGAFTIEEWQDEVC